MHNNVCGCVAVINTYVKYIFVSIYVSVYINLLVCVGTASESMHKVGWTQLWHESYFFVHPFVPVEFLTIIYGKILLKNYKNI